jgi:hypothetical protein
MIGAPCKLLGLLVPEAGLEPAQGCPYRILSPARLPFHHSGTAGKTTCVIASENVLCPSFPLLSSRCPMGYR